MKTVYACQGSHLALSCPPQHQIRVVSKIGKFEVSKLIVIKKTFGAARNKTQDRHFILTNHETSLKDLGQGAGQLRSLFRRHLQRQGISNIPCIEQNNNLYEKQVLYNRNIV